MWRSPLGNPNRDPVWGGDRYDLYCGPRGGGSLKGGPCELFTPSIFQDRHVDGERNQLNGMIYIIKSLRGYPQKTQERPYGEILEGETEVNDSIALKKDLKANNRKGVTQ